MIFGYYKNCLYTHRYKFSSEKKMVKSPSIWFHTPKPVQIRQLGRTGNWGVTISTSKYLKHNYEVISLLLKFKSTKYTSFSNLIIYLPENPNINLEPLMASLSTCIHLDEVSPERYGISEMASHVTQQICNYINVQVLI